MENKNFEHVTAIAKSAVAENDQETQKDKKPNRIHKIMSTAKAKLASQKVITKENMKKIGTAILDWLEELPRRLSHGILRGLIIAIILNVITSYFWPELPETIPTIYEFFNGFLTVGEFLYKTALGGIAAIFNGTFFEFGDTVMVEIGEMWNAFCTWISTIGF